MYEMINKYLAKNDMIHLPLEMGGSNKEVKMLFDSWFDYNVVLDLFKKQNVVTRGLVVEGKNYFSNVHLKDVIELTLEKINK